MLLRTLQSSVLALLQVYFAFVCLMLQKSNIALSNIHTDKLACYFIVHILVHFFFSKFKCKLIIPDYIVFVDVYLCLTQTHFYRIMEYAFTHVIILLFVQRSIVFLPPVPGSQAKMRCAPLASRGYQQFGALFMEPQKQNCKNQL